MELYLQILLENKWNNQIKQNKGTQLCGYKQIRFYKENVFFPSFITMIFIFNLYCVKNNVLSPNSKFVINFTSHTRNQL